MTPFALHAAPQAYARRRLDEFCAYLQSKCVYIDVWDATSKLQIGTARVSLAGLLRRGVEKLGAASTVKEYISADVIDMSRTSVDLAPSTAASAEGRVRGQLKLVVARLSTATQRSSANANGSQGSTEGGQRVGGNAQKARLRALTAGGENARVREPTAAEEMAVYQRQLLRQKRREWLRSSGVANSPPVDVTPDRPDAATSGLAALSASSPAAITRMFPGSARGSGGDLGSVARSFEMGMAEEHSLARARLQLQLRQLRDVERQRRHASRAAHAPITRAVASSHLPRAFPIRCAASSVKAACSLFSTPRCGSCDTCTHRTALPNWSSCRSATPMALTTASKLFGTTR